MGPRRPKNDSKLPPVFLLVSITGTGSSFSLSMIRQPGGKRSSFRTSGLDFTEVSHAVEPFEAMYRAIGLDRVNSMCRVSRRASLMCFEVKVFENCMGWGRVKSRGISRSTLSMLLEEFSPQRHQLSCFPVTNSHSLDRPSVALHSTA